jgi:hypothetical protein
MPTAQQQLDAFIGKYDPKVAALGRKCFAHMKKRLPGAVSQVYDNYNALAIGFAPPGKAAPLSIALYPRWVNLFFLYGATLADPDSLLKGSGSRVRSIRIDDARRLEDEDVDTLISAAVLQAGWKLDPRAKNLLVIQSIAKNQRPRRP